MFDAFFRDIGAVMQSAAARAKPVVLTGLAAMLGAMFILDDLLFNVLVIALIFGILVSTLLTLVVILWPTGGKSRSCRKEYLNKER